MSKNVYLMRMIVAVEAEDVHQAVDNVISMVSDARENDHIIEWGCVDGNTFIYRPTSIPTPSEWEAGVSLNELFKTAVVEPF
jgi:hypothetical protein